MLRATQFLSKVKYKFVVHIFESIHTGEGELLLVFKSWLGLEIEVIDLQDANKACTPRPLPNLDDQSVTATYFENS